MRVTVGKLFELFQLPEALRGIAPMAEWLNSVVDQTTRAINGGLTLRDNLASEVKTLSLRKGATAADPWTAEFTPSRRTVEGILLLQTEAVDGNTVTSWAWRFTSKGSVAIDAYPRLPSSTEALSVKLVLLFA